MGFYGADIGELRALAQSLTTASEALTTTRSTLDSTVSGARWAASCWSTNPKPRQQAALTARIRTRTDTLRTSIIRPGHGVRNGRL